MSAATTAEVIGIVKDRAAVRSKATRFFLDNARRMWGLPEDTHDVAPVSVAVQHTYNDPPPARPVDPTPTVPDDSPSIMDRIKSGMILAGVPAAVMAAMFAIWAANQPVATDPAPPTTVIVPGDQRPGSLLQYLEDHGKHRP